MKEIRLYVEGGGDGPALKTACREGFAKFLSKAGFHGCMPRIIACGGRKNAYDSFCMAIKNGQRAFLLVDSEEPVARQTDGAGPRSTPEDRANWLPWAHLQQCQGDEWDKPAGASDTDCHLMVQIMESWFLADRAALTVFFAAGFNQKKLPNPDAAIETIPKPEVYKALKEASANCKTKASYDKGEHSFKILANIDPALVCAASPWALRFVECLKTEMGVR